MKISKEILATAVRARNVEYTRQRMVGEANNEARQTEAAIEAVWDELQDMRGWHPIESAPKNDLVVVFASNQQFVAWLQDDATDQYHGENEVESDFNGLWCVTDNKNGPYALRGSMPTHWMPLPEPPCI